MMIKLTGTLICLAFVVAFCESTRQFQPVQDYFKPPPHIHGKSAYVTWTQEKGYEIKIFAVGYARDSTGVDWVAKAHFQNMVNKTGWGFLEVETKPTWPDEMQMYAAGMAEGYLTRDLIYYFWQNLIELYCDDKPTTCKFVKKFVSQNQDWVDKSIVQLKDSSPYWHQVHLMYQQLKGLEFGFKVAAKGTSMEISSMDFVLINILGDLMDLESALDPNPKRRKSTADMNRDGHCSVLIKLIEARDIYVSHVTWWRYESMLRLIKRYNFPLSTSSMKDGTRVPGESISMSSYPGMLWSMDDFYTVSSGLLVTETSISNFNKDLWSRVSPKNSLYTGVRAMVANRLAHDGREWTKLFTLFNSGTYNNQWMVLNYNLFEPERPINKGLLWISEQLPGVVVSKDVTSVLNETGYWASYNIPFTSDIYQLSGVNKMKAKYGDYYSFDHCPRAQIFARDQSKVEDLDSMMQLMRYNDYQNDPLSKCNCTPPYSAINAISARSELNPESGKYPFPALGHRLMGGTDMKLVNLDMFLLQQFIAIGGPTYDPLPPFQWSNSSLSKLRHFGQPDKFKFEPIIHHWKWL